jgi:hypothetical protein
MRRYLTPVIFAGLVGTFCVTAVIAADLSHGGDAGAGYYSAYGVRIEPIVIYDDQPGVIGRSYWYAPWANRHYFPKTGKRPKVGRLEHITARSASRAEDYFRRWTVSSGFPIYVPPTRASQFGIPPVQPMQ